MPDKTDLNPRTLGPVAKEARDAIEAMVRSGEIGPDQYLPGERPLASKLGVSRATLRAALESLAAEGIVERSPWRGWCVSSEHLTERVALRSFTELAAARGSVLETRVLEKRVRDASLIEATALGIASGDPVLDLHRLRLLDGDLVATDRTSLSMALVPGMDSMDMENRSLYQVLEDSFGVRVVRSEYVVQADGVDSGTARHLGLEAGAPVLRTEEIAFDAADVPVLVGHTVNRAESYRFRATLFRSSE